MQSHNSITIDGVRIAIVSGKIQLHVPPTFTGKDVIRWKETNADAIAEAKQSLLTNQK